MSEIPVIESVQEPSSYVRVAEHSTYSSDFIQWIQEQSLQMFKGSALTEVFMAASSATGGYVECRRSEYYIPTLIGNNGGAIPLYEFFEVVDGLVDYGTVRAQLPTLSISQISGAMAFIRKIAQLNPYKLDVDEIEDALDAENQESVDALTRALSEQEEGRVLHHD